MDRKEGGRKYKNFVLPQNCQASASTKNVQLFVIRSKCQGAQMLQVAKKFQGAKNFRGSSMHEFLAQWRGNVF